ncbi:hypothetical protein QAD02_009407 [Eretmocerus hayati]|uniref:Uncharacterized protein n=1 Tax=Eretmocerus hayati TaxID=131215 RepID=A0ACC2NBN1_9HYME|nr:hypothetical protein QAD02_009407 [Eretmocerus hayati]
MEEANINQGNPSGETMLHMAVRMRDFEIGSSILNAGGDVNVKDNEGNTPFSLAIDSGSPTMVELLLKYNPDFDMDIVRDKFYVCLLSSSTDDERIVKSMVKHGFSVKSSDKIQATMVWSSVLLGLQDFAISLVENQKSLIPCVETWYRSFLLHTQPFKENQAEAMKIITKIINLHMGQDELRIEKNHNMELFKILLSELDIELINVNILSVGGNLNENEESDIVAITKDVLMCCYDGGSPICDKLGRTGLHMAARVGNVPVIQALLDMHLDINAMDVNGKTPLDYVNDRINEFPESNHDNEAINNEKHFDSEFECFYTLLDLKIGAVILLTHVSKLITANYYITLQNLKTVKELLIMMNKDLVVMQYYLSIYSYIEQCEAEIEQLKERRIAELSYFDFLTKNYNQIAVYTKREEFINAIQMSDNILQEFEVYGPLIQHRFHLSSMRQGLLERAEIVLFDVLKWLELPLVVVREILSNLSNAELFSFILNA